MTRVYLSGAMSGKPDLNFPLFNAEAARLRSLGYDVVNPVELCPDPAATWHDCLKADIKALLDCDAIVMLPGWVDSQGAHLELNIAHRVGILILMAAEVTA